MLFCNAVFCLHKKERACGRFRDGLVQYSFFLSESMLLLALHAPEWRHAPAYAWPGRVQQRQDRACLKGEGARTGACQPAHKLAWRAAGRCDQ
jgi:hypothetical protein